MYDRDNIWKFCTGFPKHHSYKEQFIVPPSFSGEYFFLISTNQKQEVPMTTMFLSNWDEMRKFYR